VCNCRIRRNLIVERVKEGLEASKKRGKELGRPKLDKEKLTVALRMYESKEYSIKGIVAVTGISQGSLYRAINRRMLQEIETQGAFFVHLLLLQIT
jgi:DNA invertase Pin-like site-specific DNA recombinase